MLADTILGGSCGYSEYLGAYYVPRQEERKSGRLAAQQQEFSKQADSRGGCAGSTGADITGNSYGIHATSLNQIPEIANPGS